MSKVITLGLSDDIICLCAFVGTPRPTVTLDTAEEDEEASEPQQTGIKLSNLEFSVFGDYAVVPSIEVYNAFSIHDIIILWCRNYRLVHQR